MNTSLSLFPNESPCPPLQITLDAQIAAVHRELALRRVVYGAKIAQGRMTQARADYHLATMDAVLETLLRVQDAQRACIPEVYP